MRFLEFVQNGQSYTISPSTIVVVASRHVLPRDRSCSTNRNVSRLQDQFKYPCGLASRVTLVKITKTLIRVTQEKNRPLWAIKEPHVPHLFSPSLTPLLPLFLRCKLVRVRRCKIDNGVVANRMPRYEVHCSGNEFFRHSSLASISNLILLSVVIFPYLLCRGLDNASTKFFDDVTRSRRGESNRSLPRRERDRTMTKEIEE